MIITINTTGKIEGTIVNIDGIDLSLQDFSDISFSMYKYSYEEKNNDVSNTIEKKRLSFSLTKSIEKDGQRTSITQSFNDEVENPINSNDFNNSIVKARIEESDNEFKLVLQESSASIPKTIDEIKGIQVAMIEKEDKSIAIAAYIFDKSKNWNKQSVREWFEKYTK